MSNKEGGAADVTRRMICGGLAGMIAKVRCLVSYVYIYQSLFETT